MELELSKDQQSCFDGIVSWHDSLPCDMLRFSGYAGTGKTTLITLFREALPKGKRVAFCAYTGKAASVLKRKLMESSSEQKLRKGDYCGTIHGLIYEPITDESGYIIDWTLTDDLAYDLLVVDEASMVNEEIFKDLMSYGVPTIFLGDSAQLPPIEGSFNLMASPDIRLTTLHRFAENNDLIKASVYAREEGRIPQFNSDSVIKVPPRDPRINEFLTASSSDFLDTAVLCGFNKTRVGLNKKFRQLFNFDHSEMPLPGDRVICLRNNKEARDCPIYNGVQGTILSCRKIKTCYEVTVNIDGENEYYEGLIDQELFHNEKPDMNNLAPISVKRTARGRKKHIYPDCFDFGYALTVHKSQGSEWPRVVVVEQQCPYWAGEKWNRWLYTAVTRSSDKLMVVSP